MVKTFKKDNMSGQGGLISEDATHPPADEAAKSEPNATKLQVIKDAEARREASEEEEEEAVTSAHQEPSTLPWSGDKHRTPDNHQVSSEKPAPQPDDKEIYRGSPDLPHPHKESSNYSKARWRESMPEGDRWRDEVKEVQWDDKDDCSMADDEAEEEGEGESKWIPQKAPLGFMANVKIVQPSCRDEPEECRVFLKKKEEEEEQMRPDSAARFYPDWTEEDHKHSE